MEDLLTCSVCVEGYTELERPPVLLPRCGHSFCRPCISLLITGGCVVCPTCRNDQRIETASKLPTEFSLLAIIAAQQDSQSENCQRHNVKLSFWCQTCCVATCGECLFEDHPTHSHDVIRAAKYISDMKTHAQDVALKFMDALDKREQNFYKTVFNCARRMNNAVKNVSVLRKDMDDARELMKGIKEKETITSATSVAEAAKFLGMKWNIQNANINNGKKEEEVKEEKERESPKPNSDTVSNEDKLNKTDECGKNLSGLQRLQTIEPLKTIEAHSVMDDNKIKKEDILVSRDNKIEEKAESEEIKQSEEKVMESKLADASLDKMNNLRPRGRLARKALAAKMAATMPIPDNEVTEKNIQIQANETKNNNTPDLQTSSINTIQNIEQITNSEKISSIKNNKNLTENLNHIQQDNNLIQLNKEHNSLQTTTETPLLQDPPVNMNTPADHQCDTIGTSNDTNLEGAAEAADGKRMDLLQEPGLQLCVEGCDGKVGRVEWGPHGIHIFCLQFQHIPYDVAIKSSVLSALIPSKSPNIFLEISADEVVIGRVYIKLWGHLRRAHNFLTLCLGDLGFSYLDSKLLQVYNQGSSGERVLGGDYEYNNGRGGQGIISELEWNGDYAMPMTAGMITAAGSGQNATNSLFLICTEDDSVRNFSCPFGMVTAGLKYVQKAIVLSTSQKVSISDCGIFLEPPQG